MKIAIVLFNLGGPDSLEAVQPFLRNLFSDPAIIGLPAWLRLPLARFIAIKSSSPATATSPSSSITIARARISGYGAAPGGDTWTSTPPKSVSSSRLPESGIEIWAGACPPTGRAPSSAKAASRRARFSFVGSGMMSRSWVVRGCP